MHYKVNGLLIKTENAAKPISQQSQWVLQWISSLPRSSVVLDFGCGKFRYTIPLSKRVASVFAVDSIFQIERTQIINEKKCTLTEYALKYLPNVTVCDVMHKDWQRPKYDYVLCSNVLSTIPSKQKRSQTLKSLLPLLKGDGNILICTQYRNSYFNSYKDNPKANRYLDGWVISSSRGVSFYGIIGPEELRHVCITAGFNVTECYSKGESAYVVANP